MKKLLLATALFAVFCASIFALGEKVEIVILETSDLHGAIVPYDYSSDKATASSLAHAATVIREERKNHENVILLDCGDNLQDNLIQEFRSDAAKNPMICAMNLLGYDARTLGNHEFNFEFDTLEDEIAVFKQNAKLVLANAYQGKKRWQEPYAIIERAGVKIAVVGLTAPHISTWEASNPDHFRGLSFTQPVAELGKVVAEIGDKADAIVCLAHYGIEGELGSAGMRAAAEKYGSKVPIFMIGHAHDVRVDLLKNGAFIVEPGSKGSHVGKATLTFEKVAGKGGVVWKLVDKNCERISTQDAKPDPQIVAAAKEYDAKAKAIANTVVGKIGENFLPSLWWNGIEGIPTAILQETAMINLINRVQMEKTGADVSLAALFDSESDLPKGDFKKRDGVKIYKYDNTLMAVNITGKQLKKIMEIQAGDFFNQFEEGDVTISFDPEIRMYMYDMFSGVDYEIDVSAPKGSRIKNVMFQGKPLADGQKLKLALNNYRYGGLLTQKIISAKDLYHNEGYAVRDLIGEYVAEECKKNGSLTPDKFMEGAPHWKIVGAKFPADVEKYWEKIRAGQVKIPTSADGRTPNAKSVNVKDFE